MFLNTSPQHTVLVRVWLIQRLKLLTPAISLVNFTMLLNLWSSTTLIVGPNVALQSVLFIKAMRFTFPSANSSLVVHQCRPSLILSLTKRLLQMVKSLTKLLLKTLSSSTLTQFKLEARSLANRLQVAVHCVTVTTSQQVNLLKKAWQSAQLQLNQLVNPVHNLRCVHSTPVA